jgi:uncharacterized protein
MGGSEARRVGVAALRVCHWRHEVIGASIGAGVQMDSFADVTVTANAPAAAVRRLTAIQLLVVLALAALLLPALSPAAVVGQGVVIKTLFLVRVGLLVGVASWFLHLQGVGWSATGLRRASVGPVLMAVPIGALISVLGSGAVGGALHAAGVHAADYAMFEPLRGDLGEYLFWAIPVAWGSAAFGEELLFRGFALRSLETLLGGPGRRATGAAIILQALIFGALHLYQGSGGAASAATIGFVLGLVWLVTGRNLWAGIIIHGLLDCSAMTAIYLGAMPHG